MSKMRRAHIETKGNRPTGSRTALGAPIRAACMRVDASCACGGVHAMHGGACAACIQRLSSEFFLEFLKREYSRTVHFSGRRERQMSQLLAGFVIGQLMGS
jgi:hypothetical protein